MPAAHTGKDERRWRRTKARSSAQLVNCFGSVTRATRPTSRRSPPGKENIASSPASSQRPTSPYTRTSGPSSPFTRDADAFLALQHRSDTYEKKYRNLTRRASRAADRNTELEKRIHDLQQELRGLQKSSSQFVVSLQRQLDELSAELIERRKKEKEFHSRNEALARKKEALSRKVSRFGSRVETSVAKLSTQSLKDDGIISKEIRACVRDIVSFGAPLEGVDKIIHAVTKGLNIQICDHISTRSANRIILEGGIAAQLQIVDAIKEADHFTASGDGTSHKHLNYESRFVMVKDKLLALGLTQAPNHTSEEQMAGWLKLIEEMYTAYNASPLGHAYPEDFRVFFVKITGMMTDHAADQKKLRTLFHEMKTRMDREIRGERALLCLTAPKLLDAIYEITDNKIRAAGGMAAWDALPTEERDRRNSTLHAELYQKFGQAEFDKLSKAEQDEVNFFHCGGVDRMMAAWLKNGFQQPILLMNKDNAAAANSGSVVAKARAEKVSVRGGVKLCELMGMLLNNKDDKKGQQDSHGVYFSAHEHIGYSIRFPDTSNTRYQCFSEAAAEIIVNLTVYRQLMQFIRDRKMSLAYTNLEKNIWDGINDLRTIVELVVLLWYGQNFSHPVMRVVRSRTSTGDLRNLWDMGPAIQGVIGHCERVIADPDIIMGPNLSYKTASMDGQPWERPEAMYAAHALLPMLPVNELRAVFVAFLEGALETWKRFGSDILDTVLTDAQKLKAKMPATNDANEGWLGSNARVGMRRAPNATVEFINAKSQYKHNGTADFIAEKLSTRDAQQFLRKQAQVQSAQGLHQKRKVAQAEHDRQTVEAHREKKLKSDQKKAAEIAEINKCVPIFDVSRFTDPAMLKDIRLPQIDLQLKWHRLRELEMDKKTEIPPLSKLKKSEKAELVVAAVGRWMRRVDAGEVPLMGIQLSHPVQEENLEVEEDEEDDDAGYGERD
ncbi:hypothetical protein B0H12DRAFT_1077434 [Mycena haematopus]|nr:hypothetical protein B0H12DRAFT_1077434 [Mycena haematopus]